MAKLTMTSFLESSIIVKGISKITKSSGKSYSAHVVIYLNDIITGSISYKIFRAENNRINFCEGSIILSFLK